MKRFIVILLLLVTLGLIYADIHEVSNYAQEDEDAVKKKTVKKAKKEVTKIVIKIKRLIKKQLVKKVKAAKKLKKLKIKLK